MQSALFLDPFSASSPQGVIIDKYVLLMLLFITSVAAIDVGIMFILLTRTASPASPCTTRPFPGCDAYVM